jgi:hypothetical protein
MLSAPQGAGATPARLSNLASYDWSTNASPNLTTSPPAKNTVESFLSAIQISAWGESDFGDDEYVCSFAFADLRRSGYLSLIAGVGTTGRGLCSTVYIVDKIPSTFQAHLSGGAPGSGAGEDIAAKLKDVGQNDNLEFLLVNELGSIKGQCTAHWSAIYAWTWGGYTNVSLRFKNFYRQRLNILDKEIAATEPFRYKGATYEPAKKECLRAEAEKIKRFLETSPEAGLDQAIGLANSNDWAKRDLAAEILGDIGTPRARECLRVLARDSNQEVATDAKYCLSVLAKGPMQDAPLAFEPLRLQKPISSR